LIFILSLCLTGYAAGILILDYNSDVIDNTQRNSFINLFQDEMLIIDNYNIITITDDNLPKYWSSGPTLQAVCDSLGVDTCIIFKYYVLGEDFLVRLSVYDATINAFTRNDQFSLDSPEDLRVVAKRSAIVIKNNKDVKELEKLGMIIPEEKLDILERRNKGLTGFAFAASYLWVSPLVTDGLYAGEYRKVIELTAMLPIEVSTNGRMDITGDLLFGASIAAMIGYTHIFKPVSTSPYIGLDGGIEYVYGRNSRYPSGYSLGGIVARPKAGYIFMNTYNMSMYAETAFRMVTNDFFDSGIEFRFGLIIRSTN